ncbi:MAG: hypothetical protein PG979_001170 [Rickettsia asembonensis]|nr:MAG: hypothetical protein PG979_001170 [Rickettsia asembonensis]
MKTFYLFVLALTLCSCGIKKPLEAPNDVIPAKAGIQSKAR